jgi:alkanesulfonate monooxygenase SsuD/methylene tetrahydromethanopterin reductase-like flavin-dependent oxidoreductase (luciferase family)
MTVHDVPPSDGPTFGVFLNLGAQLGPTPEAVFDLTRRQALAADDLGYHDLWLTEHHFIPFGINPSALTSAAFLLGLTRRLRVGTAVTLSPLHHPVDLAERTSLLDQWSGGRFDLGIGRGGYLRDYEILGIATNRWDTEPETTADTLIDIWRNSADAHADDGLADVVAIEPPPRTRPHPPLFLGTSTAKGIACAARHSLALQHYFASPIQARLDVEAQYAKLHSELHGDDAEPTPDHLHTLIVVVADNEARARQQLTAALTESFIAGHHPVVPQAPERHVGPDGQPLDRAALAGYVAQGAIVGSPTAVVDALGTFITETGARRLGLYHEATADPHLTLSSLERFATDVAPQLNDPS